MTMTHRKIEILAAARLKDPSIYVRSPWNMVPILGDCSPFIWSLCNFTSEKKVQRTTGKLKTERTNTMHRFQYPWKCDWMMMIVHWTRRETKKFTNANNLHKTQRASIWRDRDTNNGQNVRRVKSRTWKFVQINWKRAREWTLDGKNQRQAHVCAKDREIVLLSIDWRTKEWKMF